MTETSDKGYHYMKLSLQWQPGFTRGTRGRNAFTIHGLWPARNENRMQPNNCYSGLQFEERLLGPIRSDLDRCWPSLRGGNLGFWRGQWQKHGTCMKIGFKNYFSKTLELYTKLDLENVMSNNSINPSSVVTRQKLQEVLSTNHAGKRLEFTCLPYRGRPILIEARFCFNLNYEPIDAPDVGTCGNEFLLLRTWPDVILHWDLIMAGVSFVHLSSVNLINISNSNEPENKWTKFDAAISFIY